MISYSRKKAAEGKTGSREDAGAIAEEGGTIAGKEKAATYIADFYAASYTAGKDSQGGN